MDADRLASLLPLPCRPKYLAAVAARAAAHAALLAAQERYRAAIDIRDRRVMLLSSQADNYPVSRSVHDAASLAHREAEPRIATAKSAEDAARAAYHAHHFLEDCEAWLARLPRLRVQLKPAAFDGRPTGDHASAVEIIRSQLADLAADRERALAMPRPLAELKSGVDRAIAELAQEGLPRIDALEEGGAAIDFHALAHPVKSAGGGDGSDSGLRLVAWLFGAELRAKLHGLLDAADIGEGMADADRRKAVADIDARHLALEREEEARICAAAQKGLVIVRRRECSPLAFFEVKET